jgi:hypothetical protein
MEWSILIFFNPYDDVDNIRKIYIDYGERPTYLYYCYNKYIMYPQELKNFFPYTIYNITKSIKCVVYKYNSNLYTNNSIAESIYNILKIACCYKHLLQLICFSIKDKIVLSSIGIESMNLYKTIPCNNENNITGLIFAENIYIHDWITSYNKINMYTHFDLKSINTEDPYLLRNLRKYYIKLYFKNIYDEKKREYNKLRYQKPQKKLKIPKLKLNKLETKIAIPHSSRMANKRDLIYIKKLINSISRNKSVEFERHDFEIKDINDVLPRISPKINRNNKEIIICNMRNCTKFIDMDWAKYGMSTHLNVPLKYKPKGHHRSLSLQL